MYYRTLIFHRCALMCYYLKFLFASLQTLFLFLIFYGTIKTFSGSVAFFVSYFISNPYTISDKNKKIKAALKNNMKML